jgi:NADP-dependent 3-hydroxy acid dehydrogenase YdfG
MEAIIELMSDAGSRPLTRRTAIVTGSTSGIGLGIARMLAEAGANVALTIMLQLPSIPPI